MPPPCAAAACGLRPKPRGTPADAGRVTEESGYASLAEGRRLHMRRRWTIAARAYREAIAAGRSDGWLMLGLLLQPWPGREEEAGRLPGRDGR